MTIMLQVWLLLEMEVLTHSTLLYGGQGANLQEWSARSKALKAITSDVVSCLQSKIPDSSNQKLLTEIERLKQENAKLRAGTPDQEPSASQIHLQQLKNAGRNAVLEDKPVTSVTAAAVTKWAQKHAGHVQKKDLDVRVAVLQKELEGLDAGNRPPLDKWCIQWGLDVSLAQKASEEQLLRLLALAHDMAH